MNIVHVIGRLFSLPGIGHPPPSPVRHVSCPFLPTLDPPPLHNLPPMSERIITYEELKAHTTKDSLWLLVSGKGKAKRQ